MKIAFIQTYPIYHDLNMSTDQWLRHENRDKWMPAILASEGYDVELWGVAEQTSEHIYKHNRFGTLPVRLFKVSKRHTHTKKDYSNGLVEYARQFDADLLFLKGVDGGAGLKLLDEYILPEKKPFIFVIGGKFYNRYVLRASAVFYETTEQKEQLTNPGWNFLRRKVPGEKLFFLPKSIDTDLFKPLPGIPKEFDVISAGRLIPNYKNYDALGRLSEELNVALIGDGPQRRELQKKYPKIHLLGSCPNRQMPEQLNRGKVFFHTGNRDYFPRVIPEAMASGLPAIGFREAIKEDVIPDNCGLRVPRDAFMEPIHNLVINGQQKELLQYAQNARSFTVEKYGIESSKYPMKKILNYLQSNL